MTDDLLRLDLLAPGRYDRMLVGLRGDFPRLAGVTVQGVRPGAVAMTEAGRLDSDKVRDHLLGGTLTPPWVNYRPQLPGITSEEDCLLAWRPDVWAELDRGSWVLSEKTHWRESGTKVDPFRITWVAQRDVATGAIVVRGVAHLPTRSVTSLRHEVWVDCGRGFAAWAAAMRKAYPGCKLAAYVDWNAGWKNADHRALLLQHYGKPAGMTFAWATAGIGPKAKLSRSSLIDGVLTDLDVVDADHVGGSWSYNDVNQNVHPPQWLLYRVAPRPVVEVPEVPDASASPAWDAIVDNALLAQARLPRSGATARRKALAFIIEQASPFSTKHKR